MKETLKKFTIRLSLLTLFFGMAGLVFFGVFFDELYFHSFPWLLILFFLATLVTHYVLLKAEPHNMRLFMNRYLGSTGLKLLIYLIFIVAVLLTDPEHIMSFLVSLLILYMSYTLFEVISILAYFKKKS